MASSASFQTRDGRRLGYRLLGSGPLLVCHPGGPGFSGAELADLGGLDATRTLLALDPRGTGASDPAATYTMAGYVDDLEDLRRHLDRPNIDLLGFSHGAAVAAAYAAAHPAAVRRLVLAAGLAAWTDELNAAGERAIAARSGEPWHADAVAALADEEARAYDDMAALWKRMAPLYFASWNDGYRDSIEATAVGSSAEPAKAFADGDLEIRGELSQITAPTLVICGTQDFVCGPVAAQQFVDGIRDTRLVTLDGAAHMLFIEQPEAFRSAVEGFLAQAT